MFNKFKIESDDKQYCFKSEYDEGHGDLMSKEFLKNVGKYDLNLYIGLTQETKNEYANIFNGPEFPQIDEVDRFIDICKVFKHTYYACDPLDELDEEFGDRVKTCEEIKQMI